MRHFLEEVLGQRLPRRPVLADHVRHEVGLEGAKVVALVAVVTHALVLDVDVGGEGAPGLS